MPAQPRRVTRAAAASPKADPKPRQPRQPSKPRARHHVYVVELDDRVWNNARFRRANPDYQLGKPFVYVGMTGLDPDIRFDKHKAGIQANSFVQQFGLHLLPALYERYNPLTYEDARLMEVDLGIALRKAGYGVWQA
jgi:hypothetical protein